MGLAAPQLARFVFDDLLISVLSLLIRAWSLRPHFICMSPSLQYGSSNTHTDDSLYSCVQRRLSSLHGWEVEELLYC